MKPVIVLAYDGEFDAADAITRLRALDGADVVTVTLDIGQSRDVRATRDVALAAGAVRAHVLDVADEFVRVCVLPALQSGPAPEPALTSSARLAHPVLAARIVEIAHLEGARVVAHGGGDALSGAVRAVDPSLRVLTVAAHNLRATVVGARPSRHLLQRPVADPSRSRGVTAHVEIEFDDAVPVAINGVTLTPTELLESLSLIGGAHGIGYSDEESAPGVRVLDAAYRALGGASGTVRIELLDGAQRVVSALPRTPELVNHA